MHPSWTAAHTERYACYDRPALYVEISLPQLDEELVHRRNEKFATMLSGWSANRGAPTAQTRGRGGGRAESDRFFC